MTVPSGSTAGPNLPWSREAQGAMVMKPSMCTSYGSGLDQTQPKVIRLSSKPCFVRQAPQFVEFSSKIKYIFVYRITFYILDFTVYLLEKNTSAMFYFLQYVSNKLKFCTKTVQICCIEVYPPQKMCAYFHSGKTCLLTKWREHMTTG